MYLTITQTLISHNVERITHNVERVTHAKVVKRYAL